ncbi:MAG: MFS transporter [Opitutus sp.]|nr:MFS transporter [Opitutus sp.]
MESIQEPVVMRKIFLRLIPLLIVLYIISYLDRVNVGFAALTMNKDLGLSSTIYGRGAGIFFIGYCLFEVPSNLLMVRVGARRWIARILFTWGLAATAMALVQGPDSFLAMRFILGVAEAGFFPAVVLYLTFWFPARYRGRIISTFMLSIPIALAVGAPVSTLIMELDGCWGLKGWQWLFILEGLPGLLLTPVVLRTLTDSPASANWLTSAEKQWLQGELDQDVRASAAAAGGGAPMTVLQVFKHPVILALSFVYFCATAANLGLSLFLPQIIKQLGFTTMQTGLLSAVPYVFGCIGMVAIGYLSDHFNERKKFLIATMLIATTGLGLAGWLGASVGAIAALSFATIGILGCKGPFWPLPTQYMTGTSAAAGIAFINSLGNLGGFVGPSIVGLAKDLTHTFGSGLYALGGLALLAALVTLLFVRVRRPVPTPGERAAAPA